MNPPVNDDRMAAGIASIAAHERAQREAERLDAERAAAAPTPLSITNRPGRAARRGAEKVRCPYCKSAAGLPCYGPHHKVRAVPHPSRVEAHAVQTTACPECHAELGSGCLEAGVPYRGGTHPSRVDVGLRS